MGCNVAATGHNMQGRRLYEQGQFAEALQTFQKALQTNPRNADAYYNMAATYYFLGKQHRNTQWLQQSENLYRQALGIEPTHADSFRWLAALMMENGRSNDALQMVQSWRASAPRSAEPVIELARMHRELGKAQQSMQLLVDALHIDSANPRALKAMGQIREEQGQHQLALDNYTRSYQANNLQPDVAAKIASLRGQMQVISQNGPNQPGQTRLGSVNQYVPR